MLAIVIAKVLLAVWAHYVLRSALAAQALQMLQFEAMAIGGLAAYVLFCREHPLNEHWLFSRPVQVLLIVPLTIRLLMHNSAAASSSLYAAVFDHAVLTPLVLMVLFAWLIVNVAVNERSIVRLDCRLLNYLGDISYGIYMYHALVISLVFVPFLDDYQAAPALPAAVLLHVLVAASTVLFAALSKRFFEDAFLKLKRRYQTVGSLAMRDAGGRVVADAPRWAA
jgi:peptidoglycan/LPS O-acetylase OafA/YrhL